MARSWCIIVGVYRMVFVSMRTYLLMQPFALQRPCLALLLELYHLCRSMLGTTMTAEDMRLAKGWWVYEGNTPKEIAHLLKRDKSTITRLLGSRRPEVQGHCVHVEAQLSL